MNLHSQEQFHYKESAAMRRQHPDSIAARQSRIAQFFDDLTDIQLAADASRARRSINVSSLFGLFTNDLLKFSKENFYSETGIKIGFTESVEMDNIIWHIFDVKEPRETIDRSSETFMIFHLDFSPKEDNPRLYNIKFTIDTNRNFPISVNSHTQGNWEAFYEYINGINNDDNKSYSRTQFASAVSDIISRGFFTLLGIDGFPLIVDIKPQLAQGTTGGIDSMSYESRNSPSYERITIGRQSKPITNVALKQGEELDLKISVQRKGVDNNEEDITITLKGKDFYQQLSSRESISFSYVATDVGDDAITATYQSIQEDGTVTTETAGKLNISVYEEKTFNVKFIPVNNVSLNNTEVEHIKTFLNNVYGQAVVSWETTVEQSLTVSGFRGNLTAPKAGESSYNTDMNTIINAYKNKGVDDETYYIFVVNQMDDGFMPLKSNFGFVAYNSKTDELSRAIAHELGHGAFGLKHTFDEHSEMRERGTNNLMDHPTAIPQGGSQLDISKLYKYQWEQIQNSERETQESKTQIDKEDVSLYVTIKEAKSKAKNDRYYENNETVILFPGTYEFKAIRKYVEIKEGTNKEDLANAVPKLIEMSRLRILAERGVIEDGYGKRLSSLAYDWDRGGTDYNARTDLYSFNAAGSYTISICTKEISSIQAESGYYWIAGISDTFKLNILVLDPDPVYFVRGDNYQGEYGFDNYEKSNLRSYYEDLVIPKKTTPYAIPYMSLSTNTPHVIMARTMVKKDYIDAVDALEKAAKKEKGDNPAAYTFSATKGVLINGRETYSVFKKDLQRDQINIFSLQIRRVGIGSYNNPETITVKDAIGNIIGQMSVFCADVDKGEPISLVKVFFGEKGAINNPISTPPEALLESALTFMNNKAFNQLFVKFTVGKSMEILITDEQINVYNENQSWYNKMDVLNSNGEIKQYGRNTPELDIIEHYLSKDKNFQTWNKNEKIIFVIANRNKETVGNSRTDGYQPGDYPNYCVLLHSGSLDHTTYVHEFGHIFGLEHPFEDKPIKLIDKGTSQNYMDYVKKSNMFWRWQWDILRESIARPIIPSNKIKEQ
jgi:hypothetical protein